MDPDAEGIGGVDIPFLVDLDAVGHAIGVANQIAEQMAVFERAVCGDIEGADVLVVRVVDVESLFVGAEAQAIGSFEVVDQQVYCAVWSNAVDAIAGLLLLVGLDAVGRVGKVGSTAGVEDDIVGAIEAFAFKGFD